MFISDGMGILFLMLLKLKRHDGNLWGWIFEDYWFVCHVLNSTLIIDGLNDCSKEQSIILDSVWNRFWFKGT